MEDYRSAVCCALYFNIMLDVQFSEQCSLLTGNQIPTSGCPLHVPPTHRCWRLHPSFLRRCRVLGDHVDYIYIPPSGRSVVPDHWDRMDAAEAHCLSKFRTKSKTSKHCRKISSQTYIDNTQWTICINR